MKRTNVIQDIYAVVKAALHFGGLHHAALSAMPGIYTRQPLPEEIRVAGKETTITIQSRGSLYEVTRTIYTGNEPTDEQHWLAAYCWGCCGHLVEIGGCQSIFMDTISKILYLETLTGEGITTVELFIKTL